jgi:Type I phosphodiesterase / nucleotide pyrophosphatase
MQFRKSILLATLLCLSPVFMEHLQSAQAQPEKPEIHRVLLLSIDGLHAVDLKNYVKSHPDSALAELSKMGVTYKQAFTSKPSDSFPGLLSMVTGGLPGTTGVYYDDSYDRTLLPSIAQVKEGASLTPGTEVVYDETVDNDLNQRDGGGGIDPTKLPRDPVTLQPVYPHSFLRVNTIFEVAKAAGLRTAWSDKHLSYDLVNGPSGKGVDDLFNPEIAAPDPNGLGATTDSVKATGAYDDTKVTAILNEIKGYDHTGQQKVGTPAIFGMNFQAISVGQKLTTDKVTFAPTSVSGGYVDAAGTPTPLLAEALDHTDASLKQMLNALKETDQLTSTLFIVTAKHGQSPIDRTRLVSGATGVPLGSTIPNIVNPVAPIAQATQDDVALLWLKDQNQTASALTVLQANRTAAYIQDILSGEALKAAFSDPLADPRTPDIMVLPQPGTIYTNSTKKIAEHGGFSQDDTNVALLVSNPQLHRDMVTVPVQTTQIAPTILRALELNPRALKAVEIERTRTLPGLFRRSERSEGARD